MKIFISFSNKDIDILKLFVDKILKLGLKLNDKEISCTGIENSKPKTGHDFKKWIKKEIKNANVVIQLISQNYKTSEVCLNEMGAFWIADAKVFPILIPPIQYNNIGFIHNTNQALKIDFKEDLFKLRDELSEYINKNKFNSENYNSQVDSFLKFIKQVNVFETEMIKKSEVGNSDDFSFFKKFLQEDIDYRVLLLQSQPTLNDCRLVFTSEYYKDIYEYYNIAYRDLLNVQEAIRHLSEYETFDVNLATYKDIISGEHSLPGGMKYLTSYFAINSNIKFYSIAFRKKTETLGTSFTAWTFINNRWILFANPWRVIESLHHAKYDKNLNRIINIFRFLGVFKKVDIMELQFLINKLKNYENS